MQHTLRVAVLVVLMMVGGAVCHHAFPHHMRSSKLLQAANYTTTTFRQVLDHFATPVEYFEQRLYVVDEYWAAPGGPFILYVAGEAPQDKPAGIDDEIQNIAKLTGALVLTPEHRFFGKSMPFSDLSVKNLKFLTVEQELEDLAYFVKQYQQQVNTKYQKTTRNKCLVIGGSYSGMISSFARQTHPEVFDAAWSSSGVVDAVMNFNEFDLQIAISMGQQCASAVRVAQQQIDTAIKASSSENRRVKALFKADKMTDDDFLWMLSDVTTMSMQYGKWAEICTPMISALDAGSDLVSALAKVSINSIYSRYFGEAGPYLYSDSVMQDTGINSDGASQRAWWWMVCNQVAYAQIYPGELGIRSPAVTLDFHKRKCDAVYGPGIWPPNTEAFNKKYGAKNPKTTNVYYINASQDPWQWAGLTVSTNSSLPAHVMVGMDVGHCRDLHADSPSDPADVTRTRRAAEQWAKKILIG